MHTFSKTARRTLASTASLSYLNHDAVLNHVVKQVRVKWQTDFLGSDTTGGCGFCCDHDSPLVLCVPDLHHMQQHEALVMSPVSSTFTAAVHKQHVQLVDNKGTRQKPNDCSHESWPIASHCRHYAGQYK